MNNITFLDKKLFDSIRAHLTLRSKQGVELARSVDEEEQSVSALFMLFFDKVLHGKSLQDVVEKDLNDVKVIDKFYKKAQTDNDFLLKNHLSLIQPLFTSLERKVAECLPLIWILQENLENPDAIENPAKVRDLICELAAQHKVEKGNPLFITALAALYGHPEARKIVKKDVAVVSDAVTPLSPAQVEMLYLLLLPEVVSSYSKRVWQETKDAQSINYQFLTANPVFNEFVASLEVAAYPMESTEGWECEYSMGLTTDYFPDIQNDDKEMADLISKIT